MTISNLIPAARSEAPDRPLRAVLYARTSRDPNKRLTSTRGQMVVNRRECETRGWTNVGEFVDDDRSASASAKKIRHRYAAMLEVVAAGECDVIIATETSRLLRALDIYTDLRKLCCKMNVQWCVEGTLWDLNTRAGARATGQAALAAEDEALGIAERTNRGVTNNAEAGGPHGRIPYGYKRRYDQDTGELIDQVPHPQKAKVVREIFKRLAIGDSAYSIAKDLEARGLKPDEVERWDGARMVEIAKNPTYLGKRVHRGEVIGEGTWKALVAPKVWNQVQAILNAPERRTMPDTVVRHLLTGIARCGVCDCHCPMRVLANRGRLTYSCSGCFCTAILETRLNAHVELALLTWLGRADAAAILEGTLEDREAFATAVAELVALEAELAMARAAVSARDPAARLSIASLIAAEAGLAPLIAAKRAEATALAPPAPVPELEDLLGKDDVEERWGKLTLEKQRFVIRAVADIKVYKGVRGSPRVAPGRVVTKFGRQEAKLSSLARPQ